MSDFFAQMIENKVDSSLLEVQQSMVCKITKFDQQAMRADVQPVMAEKAKGNNEPRNLPGIANIPVKTLIAGSFYIRPHYEVGDMVWVSFATHKIDDALKGDALEISDIVFDIGSACVVGGVAPTNWTAPTEFSEDGLLIGHKDGDAYLKFESDKVTAFFQGGARKVEWSNGGMRFWDGALWTNFMTHKHPTAAVGPPSSPSAGT